MSCGHGGMGIPFSVHCQCHGFGTLSIYVYSLFIYFVIGVCNEPYEDLCTVGEL